MICLLSCRTLPLGRIFFQVPHLSIQWPLQQWKWLSQELGCVTTGSTWISLKGCMKQSMDQGLRQQLACEPQLIPCGCRLRQECQHLHAGVTAGQLRRLWASWAHGTEWGLARSPSPSAYTSSGCTDVPVLTKGRSASSVFINTPCHEFLALLTGSYIPFLVIFGWVSWYAWKNPILHVCMWEACFTPP